MIIASGIFEEMFKWRLGNGRKEIRRERNYRQKLLQNFRYVLKAGKELYERHAK